MRKIHFNEDTIQEIRQYIEEGNTMKQACNRFTLKYDTLKRVMRENNIQPHYEYRGKPIKPVIPQETINLVYNMYNGTNTRLQDIVKESKLEYWQMQEILDQYFTEEEQNKRKSKLYRKSKLGNKNPMKKLTGENHPSYIGEVDDGNGYLMIMKPEWYTGRVASNYVFCHTLVICEALGLTELPKGFVVHHIDGDKKNNEINNLSLMTMGAHSKLHALQKRIMQGAETIH